jgi:deoxyribonuclease V
LDRQKGLHPWDVTPAEARAIQERLRDRVVRTDHLDAVMRVAGVDVGFEAGGAVTRAAVAVLSFPELKPLARLATPPDLILCDGQGYAHPRRFGIACHLGVWTGLPTIGVAKSRLVGEHAALPGSKGRWVSLKDQGEQIGIVLRTRDEVQPVYVSVGHRVSLTTARRYVLACCTRYRLPETTRAAHRLASG